MNSIIIHERSRANVQILIMPIKQLNLKELYSID